MLTKSGGYFQVFSQFRKVCYARLHHSMPALVALPKPQADRLAIESDSVPDCVDGFAAPSETLRALWPAGEEEARDRLAQLHR